MTFLNIQSLINAQLNGQTTFAGFIKKPSQTVAAGYWFDLSMSPGNPIANYYAATPGNSIALHHSTDGGLEYGQPLGGLTRVIRTVGVTNGSISNIPMILCDYLMYYPFNDMSNSGWNPLNNPVSIPRYPWGQVIVVVGEPPSGVGNPRFQLQYTNQSGVSGKLTPWISTGTQAVIGTLVNTGPVTANILGPFVPLAYGDYGVQSIQAFNIIDADVGLLTFCIVKPLCSLNMMSTTAFSEKDFFIQGGEIPIVVDDAYLNFLVYPNGNLSGSVFQGYIQTVFN